MRHPLTLGMEAMGRATVSDGRVFLPTQLREELGIEDGAEVVFRRTELGIEIRTLAEVVRRAQARLAAFVRPGESVVDELIRDRREAADRE